MLNLPTFTTRRVASGVRALYTSHHQAATIARALSTTAVPRDSSETTNRTQIKTDPHTSLNDLANTLSREFGAETEAATHRAVEEENAGVTSMDALLRSVREKSDPTFHDVMPMRSPILWSEALLSGAAGEAPSLYAGYTAGLKRGSKMKKDSAPVTGQKQVEDQKPKENVREAPMPARQMADSYTELLLPFGQNPELLEAYTNASGGIRTGKLMEHLDSLAGSIAYKHMLGPSVTNLGPIQHHGFYIVTAAVERLDMLAPLNPLRDLRLSGQVIYTGRSSMEVAVKMEAVGPEHGSAEELADQTVLIGRFSMVCRDAASHRSRVVNRLVTESPEERALYTLGEQMKQRRASLAMKSLSKVPPSSAEAALLHTLYLQHGEGGPGLTMATGKLDGIVDDGKDHLWMGDTMLEKCMLMFPQERNVHQKIFGGYLMRLAYELGFTNASLFTRGHVKFLSLDGISFTRPVPIGSILRLRSQIMHSATSDEYPIRVHVGVQANVVDAKTGLEQTTNDFRFTWYQDAASASPNLRQVVPKTYKEAMLWLEGKRALDLGAEIRAAREK